MPKNTGTGRNHRNNPYQLDDMFVRFHRSPAGIAWRWRTELLTTSTLAAVLRWLDTLITLTWAGAALGGFLLVALAVPHSRRFITRRTWCVLARHRIQRLCYEARLHTRSGRLPLILWTRPTRVGERSWLLCRAGICAEDFEAHIGELRAACYARDARVTRNRRWSHRDDRHHPPRHARGLPAHRLPAGAADGPLPPRPARAGPRCHPGPARQRRRARCLIRHGGPRTWGPPAPTPETETPP